MKNYTRATATVLVTLILLLPAIAFAANVDKCFKKIDKVTTTIVKELSGWSMAIYAKKSKKVGDMLDKAWRNTAKCLDKQYKPKGGKAA